MKVSPLSPARIARSLVTVLALTLIQNVGSPLINFAMPPAEAAVTQGPITDGTAMGGSGGNPSTPTPCSNGAVTGISVSASTSGGYTNALNFRCTPFNSDGSLGTPAAYTAAFAMSGASADTPQDCPTGQVAIGFRGRISGSMVRSMALICGNAMSQASSSILATIPTSILATGNTDTDYYCTAGKVLVGVSGRFGNGADQITPRCATYTGFVYAAVGSPTIVSSGPHTATVSFAAVTSNNADTPETYTVTAVSSLGTTETATGMSSPITISNLRSNVSYTITVTGLNNYGTSAATGSASLSSTPLPGSDTDTALELNGSTQYAWAADTGTGGVFDITTSLTMEAWVYPTQSTAGTQYTVICKSESYQLFHIDGIWKYSLWGTSSWLSGVSTTIPVELNEWHHIALTRAASSSVANFYYDGVLVKSDGGTQTVGTGNIADNSYPFGIGGMIYGGPTLQYGFKGKIDHVAIFDTARDSATVLSDMHSYISTSTSGLRLYYDMNEGSGSTLYNRTSGALKASDLALIASPTFPDVKEESTSGSYNVVKFPRSYLTSNNGWKVPSNISYLSALIVGGGGGAGYNSGGGGGGGGFLSQVNLSLSGSITIKVGQGGYGANSSGSTPTSGQSSSLGSTTVSGGNAGKNYASGGTGALAITTASGTSGAGGNGSSGSGLAGGNGGTGLTSSITDSAIIYAGGGGGGGWAATSNGGTGGADGGGAGGITTAPSGTSGSANLGGGGGAGSQSGYSSGSGGSGVVIVKYIFSTTKPIFTGPVNDTTTAGLTETFTVTGSAFSPMVRSYLWQISTDTGTSWSTPTQGSGWLTASYTTPVLTTSMSGTRYQYRVVVTDTDTAGFSISDTSTAVYLTINAALQVTGNSTVYKAINVVKYETFTVTGGTPNHQYSFTPTISGITIDTSTALRPVIRISDTKTVGTYYETLTVTDSVSVVVVLPITIIVAAPPSFSATSEQVDSSTILYLDAGNSASYATTNTGVWRDMSGRGFQVSFPPISYPVGTTTCAVPSYSTENQGALNFNVTTKTCGYVPNVGLLKNGYSYQMWVKRNGAQNDFTAIVASPYGGTTTQINISLHWRLSASLYYLETGIWDASNWDVARWGTAIPDQTWVYVSVIYTGSNISISVNNGTPVSSTVTLSTAQTTSNNDTGLIIGKRFDTNTDYFTGSIGYFRLYDRVLSAAEVTQNYIATKDRFAVVNASQITPTKKYGALLQESFTVTAGAGAKTIAFTVGDRSGVDWDTTTVTTQGRLSIQESLTVGTYYDTITVTDSIGQSSFLPLTFTVTKADTLTISMDTETVISYNGKPITTYPKPYYKGLVGFDTLTVSTKFSSSTYSLSTTVPTNADTYTVTAADPVFSIGSSSNYYNVIYETSTAVVNKIKQRPLNIFLYGGTVGLPFAIQLQGGDGDGAVTELLTGTSSITGCAISNHFLSATEQKQGFCEVKVTKAASQNYLSESSTVQMYFMSYSNFQPTGQSGSGTTIAINGVTSFDTSTVTPPTITSLSTTTISLAALGEFTITGTSFDAGGLTVRFWRNKVLAPKSAGSTSLVFDVSAIRDAGVTSGRIAVITINGEAVSVATLTINP